MLPLLFVSLFDMDPSRQCWASFVSLLLLLLLVLLLLLLSFCFQWIVIIDGDGNSSSLTPSTHHQSRCVRLWTSFLFFLLGFSLFRDAPRCAFKIDAGSFSSSIDSWPRRSVSSSAGGANQPFSFVIETEKRLIDRKIWPMDAEVTHAIVSSCVIRSVQIYHSVPPRPAAIQSNLIQSNSIPIYRIQWASFTFHLHRLFGLDILQTALMALMVNSLSFFFFFFVVLEEWFVW